jgi:Cu2+-containing amine oxidase
VLVIYSVAYDDGNGGQRHMACYQSFVDMVIHHGDPSICICIVDGWESLVGKFEGYKNI